VTQESWRGAKGVYNSCCNVKFKYCCIFCRADMQVCGRYTSMRGCKAKVVWYGLSVGICLISRYTLWWARRLWKHTGTHAHTHTHTYTYTHRGCKTMVVWYGLPFGICLISRYTLWWARRLWKHTGTHAHTHTHTYTQTGVVKQWLYGMVCLLAYACSLGIPCGGHEGFESTQAHMHTHKQTLTHKQGS